MRHCLRAIDDICMLSEIPKLICGCFEREREPLYIVLLKKKNHQINECIPFTNMTSIYGYWTYQDLIQGYDLADLKKVPAKGEKTYPRNSIAGWLQANGYTIFLYMMEVAMIDQLAAEEQFNTTLFVCDDEVMLREYGEDFFMKLDRSTARRLLNVHSLPRVIRTSTLTTRRVAVLDTKEPQCNLTFTNNRGTITVMSSRSSKWCNLLGEVALQNGLIMKMDGFFVPENWTF